MATKTRTRRQFPHLLLLCLALPATSAFAESQPPQDAQPSPAATAPQESLPTPASEAEAVAENTAPPPITAPDKTTPRATPDEPGARPIPPNPASNCVLPEDLDPSYGLDWARRTSFRSVCVTARWLDGMFGDNPFEESGGRVGGHISFTLDKRERIAYDLTPKLRVSVKLPNISRKANVFLDRDKESQSIAGETTALRPEISNPGEQNTTQAGVGYELFKLGEALVDFRLGLRFSGIKPKPFARSRYTTRFGESSTARWTFEETLFWKTDDGFGETSRLEYERHLGGPLILRWDNSLTFSQITYGGSWSSTATIFHAISSDRGMQWSYGISGETDRDYTVGNHGPRVAFRQRMKQRWLFLETYTGIDITRSSAADPSTTTGYVGFKVEAHFDPPR